MFQSMVTAAKYGASWGDAEVYTREEWFEYLQERKIVVVHKTFDEQILSSSLLRKKTVFPKTVKPPRAPREPPRRPPCEVCGVFLSHTAPPKDFKGRNLCCMWCSKRNGKEHGDRCEKCPIR